MSVERKQMQEEASDKMYTFALTPFELSISLDKVGGATEEVGSRDFPQPQNLTRHELRRFNLL